MENSVVEGGTYLCKLNQEQIGKIEDLAHSNKNQIEIPSDGKVEMLFVSHNFLMVTNPDGKKEKKRRCNENLSPCWIAEPAKKYWTGSESQRMGISISEDQIIRKINK